MPKANRLTPIILCSLLLASCASYQPDQDVDAVNDALASQSLAPITRQAPQEPPEPWVGSVSMDDAALSALRYNPDLQAGLEALNLARADEVQAGLLINPALSGEFVFEGGGSPVELDLGLSLNVTRILTRGWRMRISKAEREVMTVEVTGLIAQTVMAARMATFDLWAAGETRRIASDTHQARIGAREIAEELVRVGNMEAGQLARATALEARAALDLAAADLALIDARARLALVTGRMVGFDAVASRPSFPDLPCDKAAFVRASLESSFDLKAQRARMRVLAQRLGLAKVEVWFEHIERGHVPVPDNAIPMVGGRGPRGYITMGGMFTMLKVRLKSDKLDPDSWWDNPGGTEARIAGASDLARDGIEIRRRATADPKPASRPPRHLHHGKHDP